MAAMSDRGMLILHPIHNKYNSICYDWILFITNRLVIIHDFVVLATNQSGRVRSKYTDMRADILTSRRLQDRNTCMR